MLSVEVLKEKVERRIKLLMALCGKHGRICWYCGMRFSSFREVELDHIIPRSREGTHQLVNLAIACHMCNRAKSDLSLEEFLGWLRRPKAPILEMHERAKTPEAQWRVYGNDIAKGLRKPTERYKRGWKKKKVKTARIGS